MKKTVSILLVLFLLALAAGCGESKATPGDRTEGIPSESDDGECPCCKKIREKAAAEKEKAQSCNDPNCIDESHDHRHGN